MEGLKPGRIVYFVFDAYAVQEVQEQATRTKNYNNPVIAGSVCPAMVVAVFSDNICNLKVMLDGPDILWVTSVQFHEDRRPRSWHWMFEGQQTRYRPDRTEVAPEPAISS